MLISRIAQYFILIQKSYVRHRQNLMYKKGEHILERNQ